jgi:hypothetical protein
MNIPTEKVDKYKDYAIITVCPDDFRALIDSIDGEGDPKFKDVIATVDGLTDEEWKHMAMAMADELYNGDAYNDLTPLRHKPRYKATRRRVSNQSHQDDTMFMLAALTALLAAIAIVA